MKTVLVKVTFEKPQLVEDTLLAHREAFNYVARKTFKTPPKNIMDAHKWYQTIRRKFKLPSQVAIKAEQAVLSCYRTIKANKHKLKSAPIRKRLSLRLDKRIYTLKQRILSVTTLKGRTAGKLVMYPFAEAAMQAGIHDPTLFKRGADFYLAIPCKTPEPPLKNSLALGVDLGINRAVATTEGLFLSRKGFNGRLRRFSFNKRKLQALKTRSAKRKLKRVSRRHYNMSRHFTHACVNQILNSPADTIVLESLRGLKAKSRGKNMNRRLSQWAYGEFARILKYKAQALGKGVVTVNPAYTSQRDWRGLENGRRVGRRYFTKDGLVFDADWNASMNIAGLSKIPISHRKVLDGQALVVEPKV